MTTTMQLSDLQKCITQAKKEGCTHVRLQHNTIYFYHENGNVTTPNDYVKTWRSELKVYESRLKVLKAKYESETEYVFKGKIKLDMDYIEHRIKELKKYYGID